MILTIARWEALMLIKLAFSNMDLVMKEYHWLDKNYKEEGLLLEKKWKIQSK